MRSTGNRNRTAFFGLIFGCAITATTNVDAQTQNYFGTSGTISGNVWSTNVGGPYTSAFDSTGGLGGVMNFQNTVTSATGGNLTVAGINATANVPTWTAGGTISNFANSVIPINVASGMTLDFGGTQAFTNNATAGYNFTGPGVLALAGNTYGGGFTINSGTVIVRGVNSLGGGATNTLTINGGTIAGNATRNLTGKFAGGITIGGDFTLGAETGLATSGEVLTFSNNMNIGSSTRTITIGNDASHVVSGIISGSSGAGLVFEAASGATGRVILTGQSTFDGGVRIKTGATVSTSGSTGTTGAGPTSGPLGTGTLTLDGGRFIPTSVAGSTTFANPISLEPAATNGIPVGGGTVTLTGTISGVGGFIKSGSGVLRLNAANNYQGTTSVTDGTLVLNDASAIGTGPLSIDTAGVILDNTTGSNITLSTNNTQTWNQNFTFTGSRALNLGTGSVTMTAPIAITTSGANSSDNALTVGGAISGTGFSLTKNGPGRLFLTGQSTFSGGVALTAGVLHVGDQSSNLGSGTGPLGTGTVTMSNGTQLIGSSGSAVNTIENNVSILSGTAEFTTNGTLTMSGNISGTASISKSGDGTVILTGTNTYSGTTTVTSGTLQFTKRVSFYNDQTAPLINYWTNPATFIVNSGATAAFNIDGGDGFSLANVQAIMDASTPTGGFKSGSSIGLDTSAGNLTYSDVLANAGGINNNVLGLAKLGANTLTLSNANTYTGPTNVVAGTLNLAHQDAVKFSALTTQAAGTITFDQAAGVTSFEFLSLAGSGNFALQNTAGSPAAIDLTVGSNNADTTYSGAISGAGSLTKVGTGKFSLTSPNSTFAGGVTVSAGTLDVNGVSSTGNVSNGPLGTGTLTIDGGKFLLSSTASNTIANAVQLNNVPTNTIEVASTGSSASLLSGGITGAGGFTKTGAGILILSGANSYAGPTIVSTGALAMAQTQSFYSGVEANWTAANFTVESGATMVFAVGGAGEFAPSQISALSAVGTDTGGFKTGSNIGVDTSTNGDQTISTPIVNPNSNMNALGFVKSGLNSLTLSAANTFSGPTAIVGGTLELAHQNALQFSTLTTGGIAFDSAAGTDFTLGGLSGSGAITLENDSFAPVALSVGNNNADTSYSGVLSGAGSLVKVGTGKLTLTTARTYSGGTTVNSGTLAIGASAAVLGTGPLTLNTGAILDTSSATARTLGGNIAQNWNGYFTFAGTGALNVGTGNVTLGDNIAIAIPATDANANALTVGGIISDGSNDYTLTKSGTGRLFLSNNQSTFSGGVILLGGSINVNEQSSVGIDGLGGGTGPLGIGAVTINGGRLIGSSVNTTVSTLENAIKLTGPASGNTITANGTLTLTGVISGMGGFLRGGNGKIILTNANTFSGDTNTTDPGAGRVLNLSNELALQNSTLITAADGASIEFDGAVGSNAFTLGGLSGDRDLSITNTFFFPTITLSIGNNNGDATHTGVLSGDGNIVKVGTGKATLGGANTYTGTTTINAGTLLVNGTHTGTVGAYTVNSGGTLGGTGDIDGAVSVASGGAVAPGASIESLDVDSLTLASGSLLNFELGAPGVSDVINVAIADGFTANGGTFNFTNAGGMATGNYTLIDYSGVLGGAFGNLALGITQPAGFTYMLVNNTGNTSVDLQVTQTSLPGDFNLDGKVDAADYVVWRKNPASFLPATYDTWRSNFGNPPGSGAGLGEASVPEPTACVLLLVASLVGLATRRQRTRFGSK